MIRRIGILSGGGDCPGINAVIRAVTYSAIVSHGWEVIGIEDGYDGFFRRDGTRRLRISSVRGIWMPRVLNSCAICSELRTS